MSVTGWVDLSMVAGLFEAFPHGFINHNLEFIATGRGAFQHCNVYICLGNCKDREDVKAKLLEWMSRDATYSMPYKSDKHNDELHQYILHGINTYLGTNFSEEAMGEIYTHLGNCINHNKTIKFIRSGYDMNVLVD